MQLFDIKNYIRYFYITNVLLCTTAIIANLKWMANTWKVECIAVSAPIFCSFSFFFAVWEFNKIVNNNVIIIPFVRFKSKMIINQSKYCM